ncbi:decapping nuclease DXO homolog isoform X2 [Scaptodrosophila lebanonensis]|uniref:Decapping nuclease n=1 Tax=Drosophila lebanonensis TaxID=7225 RepID=A0A6J2U141_DROLE|nr:decapping nuclease DXO homolog isoform X2 [Scaptodrosophila lebanonensis]
MAQLSNSFVMNTKLTSRWNPIPFPFFKTKAIGYYSISGGVDRKFYDDARYLTYYSKKPAPPLDLNAGIEQVVRHGNDPDHYPLYMVCQYISNHRELLRATDSGELILDADFVTRRGILSIIMCTPYIHASNYRFMASYLNGTTYISAVSMKETLSKTALDRCSWGFKFEQYCTSYDPNVEPDTSMPVIEDEDFNCIFRAQLGELRLMFAAEMDGLRSNKKVDLRIPEVLDSTDFVEMKTGIYEKTPRQRQAFESYTSLKWWSQSFLSGGKTIVEGLRDANGIVRKINEHEVAEIPKNKPWKRNLSAVFLKHFLEEVKQILKGIDDPYAVVQFDFEPMEGLFIYHKLQGPNVQQIIPDFYRQMMRGTANSTQI